MRERIVPGRHVAGSGRSAVLLDAMPRRGVPGATGDVMISMVKIASGEDAWRYFQDSVAAEAGRGDAVDYYAAEGTPAGRWYGAGVAGLGVAEGRTVTPSELSHLFGAGAHPLTGEPLARKYVVVATLEERIDARVKKLDTSLDDATREHAVAKIIAEETAHTPPSSVAGFELVFNPPKSVSVLWALSPASVQEQIKAAHEQALEETLAILERDALRTRAGAGGVAQLEVLGAVATGFDHWDSREGDPQLHTHLLIANRVQTADGQWRTIDSRHALSPHVVTLSETYDAALMDALSNRLGVQWTERSVDRHPERYARFLNERNLNDSQESRALFADELGVAARNRKWEIDGIPSSLLDEFSQRSTQIAQAKDELIEEYRAATGKEPSRFQIWRMRQAATRRTRASKTVHSLEELSAWWRERAARITDPDRLVGRVVEAGHRRLSLQSQWSLHGDDLANVVDVDEVAGRVLAALTASRTTWTRANALAEVHRALKPVTFRSILDRDNASRRVLHQVVAAAVPLTPRNPLHAPREFRQSDGASAFAPTARELFTTRALLDAERRLVAASHQASNLSVGADAIAAMLDAADNDGRMLGTDQRDAVARIATSGLAVDVLVGPAGAGKTTTHAKLRELWEHQHGQHSVIGLAPSAAAARVLGDALSIETENTAMWITGSTGDRPRFAMRPGQLVIVDEAGMSGTLALDELRAQAAAAGAKLLLVGDWAQLGAVDAGGAFSLIVAERGDRAAQLDQVWRFTAEWERDASVLLRLGDVGAIDAYAAHDRMESGSSDEMLADALAAWRADVAAGLESLLIASDNAQVRTLNLHAQEWLREAGKLGDESAGISEQLRAHLGDRVVTRNNNRTLRDSHGEWVRNGQEWTVVKLRRNGEAVVENADGARVTLPVAYLREHVQLAYATTAHRSQGRTVDTAHMLVDETTTREVAYVGLTRGKQSNKAYVTAGVPDSDTSRQLERGWRDVLESVLRSTGADTSATATARGEQARVSSIRQLAAEYDTLAAHIAAERYGAVLSASLGEELHAQLRGDGGYDALVALMRRLDEQQLPVAEIITEAVHARRLDTANDAAAVVHQRLTDRLAIASANAPQARRERIAGLIPVICSDHADMQRALDERATAIRDRAERVLDDAIAAGEPWTSRLRIPGGDDWREHAVTIAAYRDKWGVTSSTPLGPIDDLNHQRRTDYEIARTALPHVEAAAPAVNVPRSDDASRYSQMPAEQTTRQRIRLP
ncbi:MobF family relaxase [Agromyces sp. Marseille-P2726]|uniref:MobF family relaxase n=1 Tax=Agromyces sp. Marseille-P2726 TaxID=2709132 RepID=UPI00156DCDBA|nr:MobF family relaxase [Agromyces sp. Marseille-P2726]